jgi:regulator of PEP synthase PpsR (kinase-PPPase family)
MGWNTPDWKMTEFPRIGVQAQPLNVLVLSDATGATAEAMATSVLAHFENARWLIRRHPLLRTVEQIEEVLESTRSKACVIVFTFVSRTLSNELVARAASRDIPCVDILQPLIGFFSEVLGRAPHESPGAFAYQPDNMFRLATAIDFALQHDNGQGLDTLEQSDVIILGLPRSGKTPTSMYLACRAVKAATIPVIKDQPLSERIEAVPAPKVGLRISLDRLMQIRPRNPRRGGGDVPWYADRPALYAELEYCERVFKSVPGIHAIDVTNRSVEEISDFILREVL